MTSPDNFNWKALVEATDLLRHGLGAIAERVVVLLEQQPVGAETEAIRGQFEDLRGSVQRTGIELERQEELLAELFGLCGRYFGPVHRFTLVARDDDDGD